MPRLRAGSATTLPRSRLLALALTALVVLAAATWFGLRDGRGEARATASAPLMLFTSLPIYWSEAPDIAATLKGGGKPHWARAAIEAQRALRPVDVLEAGALGRGGDLLMVQPRPLAPAENVALDRWVGAGGRLLLFADPALTASSAFALGDRRRPEDIVLLSPILARWGLRLEFDDEQPAGERLARLGGGAPIPVNLAGRFAVLGGGREDTRCRLGAGGLLAECSAGRGRVVAVADAALFEDPGDDPGRRAALAALLARAFGARPERGNRGMDSGDFVEPRGVGR
jgi:hypothetical protein